MKYLVIKSECKIPVSEFSKNPDGNFLKAMNKNKGEEAFSQLQEASSGSHERNQFHCTATFEETPEPEISTN